MSKSSHALEGRDAFARRIREVRVDKYGENGQPALAAALGVPVRTWVNYEAGVTLPGEIALRLIAVVGVSSHWLLSGEGEKYVRECVVDDPKIYGNVNLAPTTPAGAMSTP